MTTAIATEFDALRLSAWGMAVMLVWLLWQFRRRPPVPLPAPLIRFAAALLAGTVLFAFTVPLFGGYIVWLNGRQAWGASAALTGLVTLEILFISVIAPRYRWSWPLAWLGFAHVAKWGALWL